MPLPGGTSELMYQVHLKICNTNDNLNNEGELTVNEQGEKHL